MLNVYNDVSEISINETELFLDDSTSQPVSLSARINPSTDWQITIYRCSDISVVAQSSGTGPGTATITWSDSAAAPGIYDLSISPGVVSSGGAVSPTDTYIGVSYAIGAYMLICGVVNGADEWDQEDAVEEMTDVIEACNERSVPCTVLLDPFWVTRIPNPNSNSNDHAKRGLDYWLGGQTARVPHADALLLQLLLHWARNDRGQQQPQYLCRTVSIGRSSILLMARRSPTSTTGTRGPRG